MKKADRIELAKKCLAKIRELKLEVKIDDNWVVLSPPDKIPAELGMDIVSCVDRLVELFENERK